MTIEKFISMAIDETYYCYIYSNIKQYVVFEGMIEDIPEELLKCSLASWEITDKIGLNIV